MKITLNSSGYFQRDRTRFIPVGVNYWPGSCGVELWQAWPAAEIQNDLDVVARLGLNTVRFFLRWQDFEPAPGVYADGIFDHLAQMLAWCRERGLAAQPALFVGWMSGGIFWPDWRQERNLYTDPFMVERSIAFARRAATLIVKYDDTLLGIDLGNELSCLPDDRTAPPSSVVRWCEAITRAIRSAYPEALIVSGTDHNTVTSDTGWRLGQMPGTDYYSMHSYPVPAWQPVAFDGMTDPLCQSLLPTYTGFGRAFGPVLLQEFGTIVTFGARQQDAYLRSILPACWAAGANGFLWWCLRDIAAPIHPYLRNGFEGTLGLVDQADQIKPGLEYFVEFAAAVATLPDPECTSSPLGFYIPEHYYPVDNPASTGQTPHELSVYLTLARHLAAGSVKAWQVVRGGLPIPEAVKTLIVPGALLPVNEAEMITDWVKAGGCLVWHAPDPVNWGPAYIRLLGAKPVDYYSPCPIQVHAFGKEWHFDRFPRSIQVEVEPTTASVLGRDNKGRPVVLTNQVGQGRVTYALPCVEEAIAAVSGDRELRQAWQDWYEGMFIY